MMNLLASGMLMRVCLFEDMGPYIKDILGCHPLSSTTASWGRGLVWKIGLFHRPSEHRLDFSRKKYMRSTRSAFRVFFGLSMFGRHRCRWPYLWAQARSAWLDTDFHLIFRFLF